jgi:hypothetical protein
VIRGGRTHPAQADDDRVVALRHDPSLAAGRTRADRSPGTPIERDR